MALLLLMAPLRAEMDAVEYESRRAPAGAAEIASQRDRIEDERVAEAERETRHQAMMIEEQARLASERARRPYPQRLLEDRCGTCHRLDVVGGVAHTAPGWLFVIARMRWWNGAPLSVPEAFVLTRHLAAHYPAQIWKAATEYLIILMPPIILAVRWGYRRRTRC